MQAGRKVGVLRDMTPPQVVEKVAGRGHMFREVGTRNLGRALQRALGPAQDRAALEPAATLLDGLATMVTPTTMSQTGSIPNSFLLFSSSFFSFCLCPFSALEVRLH